MPFSTAVHQSELPFVTIMRRGPDPPEGLARPAAAGGAAPGFASEEPSPQLIEERATRQNRLDTLRIAFIGRTGDSPQQFYQPRVAKYYHNRQRYQEKRLDRYLSP
jgi:hypothetical protein